MICSLKKSKILVRHIHLIWYGIMTQVNYSPKSGKSGTKQGGILKENAAQTLKYFWATKGVK